MALETTVVDREILSQDERGRLDAAVEVLRVGSDKWSRASLRERADLLRRTHDSIGRSANRWALTAVGLKRLDAASSLVGEEWLSGPYAALSGAARLATSLDALVAGRSPLDGLRFHPAPGGRQAVDVMPVDLAETLLLRGFSAEVWLRPGITADDARRSAGAARK